MSKDRIDSTNLHITNAQVEKGKIKKLEINGKKIKVDDLHGSIILHAWLRYQWLFNSTSVLYTLSENPKDGDIYYEPYTFQYDEDVKLSIIRVYENQNPNASKVYINYNTGKPYDPDYLGENLHDLHRKSDYDVTIEY